MARRKLTFQIDIDFEDEYINASGEYQKIDAVEKKLREHLQTSLMRQRYEITSQINDSKVTAKRASA